MSIGDKVFIPEFKPCKNLYLRKTHITKTCENKYAATKLIIRIFRKSQESNLNQAHARASSLWLPRMPLKNFHFALDAQR